TVAERIGVRPIAADGSLCAGAMPERTFLRIGAGAAVLGGATALAALLLHGPAPASEEGLRQLARGGAFGVYETVHMALAVALILLLGGFAAVSRAIEREPAASWARLALLGG